jgi:hypothetical protein
MVNLKNNGWDLVTGLNTHIISMLGNQAGVICMLNLKNSGWNLGTRLNLRIIGMLGNQAGVQSSTVT